jgi:hypothetical protein
MTSFFNGMLLERRTVCLELNTLVLIDIDCFVSQSRGNDNVKEVWLCLHALFGDGNDVVWDKLGEAIDYLQVLEMFSTDTRAERADGGHDDDLLVPARGWEILARILSHVRQKVTVELDFNTWAVEDVQALARAIRGHPAITYFNCGKALPHESMDSIYSALATLPALEAIQLSTPPEDEIALANPESLAELCGYLLCRPSLLVNSISQALIVKQQRAH